MLVVVAGDRLVETEAGAAAVEVEGGDLVVEARAVEEAPADAGVLGAGEFCQGRGDLGEGLAEGRFDDALFFLRERVAVRGADGLVDRGLSVGLAGGPANLT